LNYLEFISRDDGKQKRHDRKEGNRTRGEDRNGGRSERGLDWMNRMYRISEGRDQWNLWVAEDAGGTLRVKKCGRGFQDRGEAWLRVFRRRKWFQLVLTGFNALERILTDCDRSFGFRRGNEILLAAAKTCSSCLAVDVTHTVLHINEQLSTTISFDGTSASPSSPVVTGCQEPSVDPSRAAGARQAFVYC
jgi:hypothetical protein